MTRFSTMRRSSALITRATAHISIWALIAGMLVGVGLATATTVADPVSSARADTPPADLPTSIVLASDVPSFAAGSSATLTATVDADIADTSSTITITDETTSSAIATCSSGLTCSVAISFLTGPAHTYVATVNDLTSNEVTVGREGWSVALTTNKTVFESGDVVTLTAVANQNVGDTYGTYAIRIFDETAGGGPVVVCSGGTTCATTTSFLTGGTHTYVADVSSSGSPAYPREDTTDVQATSNEVTASRDVWTVSLSENRTVFAAGQGVTLTAVANQNVGDTGGAYSIRIFDETTGGGPVVVCGTGTSCSGTTSFLTGGAHTYIAEISSSGSPFYPREDTTDVQATSNTVTAAREVWTVSLSSDKTSFAAGDSVTLTAVANQNVGDTVGTYAIRIFDETAGGGPVVVCNSGTTCTGTTSFLTGGTHTYIAEVSSSGYSGYPREDTTDVQATSDEVTASRDVWTVSLAENKTVFAAGDVVTLTATANQNVANTGGTYSIRIFDETTGGAPVVVCNSGTTCSGASSFLTGGPHTYIAEVSSSGSPLYPREYTTDVQATSNTVTAEREVWTVSLSSDKSSFAAGDVVTSTATANQNVANTGGTYSIRIFDETAGGGPVAVCNSGTTCSGTTSFLTGGAHTYVAEVSSSGYSGYPREYTTDVQATSNEVTAAREVWTLTLSSNRTVFAAGQDVTLTANANQNVGNTGGNYSIRIFDTTTDSVVAVCSSGTTCTGTSQFYSGGAHTYIAEVSSAGYAGYPREDTTDVQATSNPVSATREAWTIAMTTSAHSYVSGGTAYLDTHLHATTNQNVGDTAGTFDIVFWDFTTSTFLYQCSSGSSCSYTLTAVLGARPDAFMAFVMPSDSGLAAPGYYEADSDGFSRSTGVGAVLPGESAGGANPAENNSCGCAHGDPINTETGEFDLSVTDDGIPGAGPAVAVERSYASSEASASGPFGYGWATNFTSSLAILASGNATDPLPRQVQITQENGSTVVFTENGDQTYSAPARVMATLSWDATAQQWTYTRQLREVMVFDSFGELIASKDLNGNSVTYGYTSGHVTTISGSGGRALTLTWSGGNVTEVTDSAGRSVSYSYDTAGNLVSVTRVDGSVNTYAYDSNHLMTSTVKPDGGTTTNVYDSSNRVVSQTDPVGRVTTFNYIDGTTYTVDPDSGVTVEIYDSGLLTSQTKAAGTSYAQTTTYTYDDNNDVASMTDQLGNVTNYTYDANGDVLTETDPLSRTTTWTYDGLGDVLTVVDPLARESTATYDTAGNKLSATSPGGNVSHWTYNSDGTIASSEDALGNTTSYGHNTAGDLTSTTDPDSRTNSQTYNSAGFVTSSTDSGGNVTTVTTDLAGRTLTVTDPNAHTTTYTYDSDGNRTSAETAAGHVTTYTYDLADQLTATTDPGGYTTSYTYTGTGLLATTTDPNSHATSTVYNSLRLATSVTNGDGKVTHFGYDGDGRQVSETLPSGAESSVTYDNAGQKISSTDALGGVTTNVYDNDGELTSTTDPLSRVTRASYTTDGQVQVVTLPDSTTETSSYNANGQLTDFENADGAHTTYTYDDAGLLTAKTEPGSMTTGYTYTAAGQPAETTNPDATTVTDSYNAGGLLTGVSYSANSAADVAYSYDADNLRTGMTDATGTSSYSYNSRGLMTAETDGAGARVGYEYDGASQLTSIAYPGNKTVTYGYDGAGQMTSLTDSASNETAFAWTDDGQLRSQADPNGITETRTYDADGRTTDIAVANSSTTLANYGYGYDSDGELTSDSTIDPNHTSSFTHTYGYTNLTQLTSIDDGTTTSDYTNTPAGEITSNTAGSALAYNSKQELTSLTPGSGPVDLVRLRRQRGPDEFNDCGDRVRGSINHFVLL